MMFEDNLLTLMFDDIPVLEVQDDIGKYHILQADLLPYSIRSSIIELSGDSEKDLQSFKNLNYYAHARDKDKSAFKHFLASRVLSISRSNAKKLYNAFGFSQEQTDDNKAEIALSCRAVTMTDNYWIRFNNENIKWKDIDPKHISLNQAIISIALKGSSLTLQGKPHSPEYTNLGSYAKAWIREDDGPYLYKRSTEGELESEIEISVSKILDCFNVPHVRYLPASYEGDDRYCKCKNMCDDDLSIVYAEDYNIYCNQNEKNLIDECISIDSENFFKMCVVDYLISNSDRHSQNWGFYVNNVNGRIICLHPLYDHNNAFNNGDMKASDGGPSIIYSGQSKKDVAKYSINRCSLKCISAVTDNLFLNEVMRESFFDRASILGLYHKQNKIYVPNNIFSDDSKVYYDKIDGNIKSAKDKIDGIGSI